MLLFFSASSEVVPKDTVRLWVELYQEVYPIIHNLLSLLDRVGWGLFLRSAEVTPAASSEYSARALHKPVTLHLRPLVSENG